jgi:type II secretory pathway predicted ATPase ExeA
MSGIEGVRSYFGFTRLPFRKDLPPASYHHHRSHDEAVARITFLVEEGAIGLLTGEVGSGKSVALRAALSGLEPSRHTVIYLGNPSVGSRGLYQAIVARLGGTPRFHKAALIPQAEELLRIEADERKKKVILALDEAHLLDQGQLEELRLLSAGEMDAASPFSGLVLAGQPSLRSRLRLGSYAALEQRITIRYVVQPMTAEETKSYICHHLGVAGRAEATLFSDDAVARIHDAGRGLPRAVNNLCMQALVATYASKASIVDDKAARVAISEVSAE